DAHGLVRVACRSRTALRQQGGGFGEQAGREADGRGRDVPARRDALPAAGHAWHNRVDVVGEPLKVAGPVRRLDAERVADTACCRVGLQAASAVISGSALEVSVTDELPVNGSNDVLAISHFSTDSGSVWVADSAIPTVSPGSKCAVLRVDTSRF